MLESEVEFISRNEEFTDVEVFHLTRLPNRTVPMAELSATQLWHRLKSHAMVKTVQSVDVLHLCRDALTGPGIGISRTPFRRRDIPRSLTCTAKCFVTVNIARGCIASFSSSSSSRSCWENCRRPKNFCNFNELQPTSISTMFGLSAKLVRPL